MARRASGGPGDALWPLIGLIALLEVALLAYLAVQAWPDDDAPPAPEAPQLVVLQDGDVVDDQVSGTVEVVARNVDPDGVRILVVAGDGTTTTLASDTTTATWDSTSAPNGPYVLEARRGDAAVATSDVSVQNARRDVATTAAVVGTTTAVAAGGSAIGSSIAGRLAMAGAQIGKESLLALGEDHLALRTAHRDRRRLAGKWVLLITLVLVLLFFAFEGLESYTIGAYVQQLPVAGGVAMVFVAMALGIEYLLGVASRARTRLRFLTSGAVSLVASAIIFRTPFGYPGYVEEVDDEDHDGIDDEPPHVEGIRALASLTVLITLLLPFLYVGYRFNYEIVEEAMEVALVGLATSALPMSPLPGHDIWKWRRSVAVAFALGAYTLYFGFQLAFLPTDLLVPLGVIGAALYVAVFAWLRGRSADPHPKWYLASWRIAAGFRRGAWLATPRPLRALGAGMRRAGDGMGTAVDRGVDGAKRGLQAALAPLAKWAGDRAAKKQAETMAAAQERFLQDADELLDGLDDLDDDAEITIQHDDEDRSLRIGDLRDDVLRIRLMQALGPEAGHVSLVDGDGLRTVDVGA